MHRDRRRPLLGRQRPVSRQKFREVFLQWPEEADKAISGIATWAPKADVWVCTHLLNEGHR